MRDENPTTITTPPAKTGREKRTGGPEAGQGRRARRTARDQQDASRSECSRHPAFRTDQRSSSAISTTVAVAETARRPESLRSTGEVLDRRRRVPYRGLLGGLSVEVLFRRFRDLLRPPRRSRPDARAASRSCRASSSVSFEVLTTLWRAPLGTTTPLPSRTRFLTPSMMTAPFPCLEAEELIDVVVDLLADLLARLEVHQHELAVLPGVEHLPVVRVRVVISSILATNPFFMVGSSRSFDRPCRSMAISK